MGVIIPPVAGWTQPTYSPALLTDLFPTTVTVKSTGQIYPKTRILLTDTDSNAPATLYVFTDGPTGPGLALSIPYDETKIFGDSRSGYDIFTPQGLIELRPEGSCGCGSRLKGLQPFSAMRHTAMRPVAGPIPAPAPAPPQPAPSQPAQSAQPAPAPAP